MSYILDSIYYITNNRNRECHTIEYLLTKDMYLKTKNVID